VSGGEFDPGNRVIAALDVGGRAEADSLVQRLGGAASWIKIGLQLFCAAGPEVVRDYAERHKLQVMLDLKLHDIPETVGRTVREVAKLGAGLLTIHAGGGKAMMDAAVKASREAAAADGKPRMRILAVTVLTSMDDVDLNDTGQQGPTAMLVLKRAKLAAGCGCDGVVASAIEAALIRTMLPPPFLVVTPGIRTMGTSSLSATLSGDQKRIASPVQARRAGADLIVVGRPIRDSEDPAAAARAIAQQLRAASGTDSFSPIDDD